MPNKYRVGPVKRMPNYGVIKIDWSAAKITLGGRDGKGEAIFDQPIDLSTLVVGE